MTVRKAKIAMRVSRAFMHMQLLCVVFSFIFMKIYEEQVGLLHIFVVCLGLIIAFISILVHKHSVGRYNLLIREDRWKQDRQKTSLTPKQ